MAKCCSLECLCRVSVLVTAHEGSGLLCVLVYKLWFRLMVTPESPDTTECACPVICFFKKGDKKRQMAGAN